MFARLTPSARGLGTPTRLGTNASPLPKLANPRPAALLPTAADGRHPHTVQQDSQLQRTALPTDGPPEAEHMQ